MWIVEEEQVKDFNNNEHLGSWQREFKTKKEAELHYKCLCNCHKYNKTSRGEFWIVRLFKEDDYDNARTYRFN